MAIAQKMKLRWLIAAMGLAALAAGARPALEGRGAETGPGKVGAGDAKAAETRPADDAPSAKIAAAWRPKLIAWIQDKNIPESSGIVESRKHPGIFWTHNDSANPPQVFAIDRQGKTIATFDIDAKNHDWEDLTLDDAGHLYLCDTGNNDTRRKTSWVLMIDEPDPTAKQEAHAKPLPVRETWTLEYPAHAFDCESLFLWKGQAYVISKNFMLQNAALYTFSLDDHTGKPITLRRVCDVPLRTPVTSADISADGATVAVLTNSGLWVFDIGGDPSRLAKAEPAYIALFNAHIEACCFVKEGVLVTAESREIYLFSKPPAATQPATAPATRPAVPSAPHGAAKGG